MRRGVVVLWFVALLPACHGSGQPGGTARHGQRLVTATISDPKTFNPVITVDSASGDATGEIFNGLVRLNPHTLEMEPALAERWEHSPDGISYTFHLRHDVRWHDGKPFTAADVAFTFDAIYDDRVPNSMKHVLLIEGQRIQVAVVDDYTVRLTLPRPFAPLLMSMGFDILPQHILGPSLQNGTFNQQWGINTPPEQIIGTGPYRMVHYEPGQFIELQRNPDYWMRDGSGAVLPYIEHHTDLIVPNQDTVYLKFSAGQTDIHSPRPEEVADLKAKANELKIIVREIGLETGSTFVGFNRNPRHYVHGDPHLTWFTDPHFLKAIAHAIDKQSMIQNCLNGYGKPAIGEISEEDKRFYNPTLTDYAYDLEEARRELKAGGYVLHDGVLEDSAGHPVEFAFYTNSGNQVREKICSILKEDWTKLGMKVNYRPLDFATLVEKIDHTFDWDAILLGFSGSPEPNSGANLLRSSGNLHFWNPSQLQPATPWEAEIDRLLEDGSRELDESKRPQFYRRIDEILHEQLPMIETVRATRFVAHKVIIQNYDVNAWGLYRPELVRIAE
jgi:peptide/nickel transport system substrate-binding protein